MSVDLVLRNCRIVNHDETTEGGIAVHDGKIVAIGADGLLPKGTREIDAKGRFVLPGLVDPHVHLAAPSWPLAEGIRTATAAAAAGGVTTIMHLMAWPGSLAEGVEKTVRNYQAHAYVDGTVQAAIMKAEHVTEIPIVAKLGVTSFKFALPYRGEEAVSPLVGVDDGLVFSAFEEIAKLGYPANAKVHAENVEIFWARKEKLIKQGTDDYHWHDARPNYCEAEAMLRSIYFAKVTGCPLYILHMTIREGVDIVRKAKGKGVNVVVETCPQYLVLTRFDVDRVLGKVNPPLRGKEDNEALWRGIQEGVIEFLGSDDCPCAKKHKTDFWTANVGIAGVETLLPVMLSEGVNKGRISLEQLVKIASYNPARYFGIAPRKGVIKVGSDADLTMVDLDKEAEVSIERLHYISDYTPFEGWRLKGWPVLTILRGSIIAEDGEVVGRRGGGRFIPSVVPANA
ncbi:MAG: amidohydrolase family protein [Chloroflexi bacterium]|nr:amidohydrolase family protein [Chloroflexota bacterium]